MKNIFSRLLPAMLFAVIATPAFAHTGHGFDLSDAFYQPLHALQHFFERLGLPASATALLLVTVVGMLIWLVAKRLARSKQPKPIAD